MSGFRVIKIVIEQELKRFNGSGLLVRLMRPYLLEMVQMNICELLLSAFGIWHVESEDAKKPSPLFPNLRVLGIHHCVTTHTQKTSNYNIMNITKAVLLSGSYCKSGCYVSILLKVHTALRSCRPFDREV